MIGVLPDMSRIGNDMPEIIPDMTGVVQLGIVPDMITVPDMMVPPQIWQ
jgi:hypothetical protein